MSDPLEAMSDRLAVAKTGASVALGGEAIIAVKTTDGGAFPRGTKLPFIDQAPLGWEELDRVPWALLTSGFENVPGSDAAVERERQRRAKGGVA